MGTGRLLPRLYGAAPLAVAGWLVACSSGQGAGFAGGGLDAASLPGTGDDGGSAAESAAPEGSNASSGGGSSGSSGASDASPATDAHGAPSSFDVAKVYAGTYAAQVKFRKVISLSGGLGTFNALATFYITMQLTADATKQLVVATSHDCHVDLTGTGTGGLMGATLQLPDSVFTMMSLDMAVFSASSAGGTTSWSLSEIQGPMGWHWSSPSDTLPTSSGDPRVFDQDGDGNAGVTLHVYWSGTDYPLYVVMTQREALTGTASGGALTGTTVDTTAMNVIGNTTVLLGATVSWAPDPNTADNTTRIVKTPSLLTCAELAAQTMTLFP